MPLEKTPKSQLNYYLISFDAQETNAGMIPMG
jgi:hypothetical protein